MHVHGSSGPRDPGRAFAIGIALNLAFTVVEVVYGVTGHSLALLSDAGHNLSDVLGLLLAWGAARLARVKPSPRRTYGLRRSTILAALANAVALLLAVGGIAWEAISRLRHPESVAATTVIVVAGIGVLLNGGSAMLFFAGRRHDLNVRGAFLHLLADAGISLGVVVTGVAIVVTGQRWLDPAVSLGIAGLIAYGTWGLFRESLNLALDAVPEGVDPGAVTRHLENSPGVASVHDVHIWAMSTSEAALTAHLVMPDRAAGDEELANIAGDLQERFGIHHATLQVERGEGVRKCSRDGGMV